MTGLIPSSASFCSFAFRLEAIAHPRVCDNVLRRFPGLNFLAQLIDEDAKILWLLHALSAPNRIEQDAMGKDLVRVAGHKDQKIKLLGREMDFFTAHTHLTGFRVNAEVAFFYWIGD